MIFLSTRSSIMFILLMILLSTITLVHCVSADGHQCITSDVSGNQDIVGSSLPGWCYNPPGTDCDWYKQCLARGFPCEAEPSSYALEFGDAICTEFTAWQPEFSNLGQRWIDETRACLQQKLVPILFVNSSLTCAAIQTFAFRTHVGCYNDQPPGSPVFCELPISDWFRIAWIVKQSFLRETKETIQQAVEILGGCVTKAISNWLG